jgi:photoactive yellow protein
MSKLARSCGLDTLVRAFGRVIAVGNNIFPLQERESAYAKSHLPVASFSRSLMLLALDWGLFNAFVGSTPMSSASVPAPAFKFQIGNSISDADLDSLPYGVIQLDAEGAVLRYNAREESLSGLSRQKVVGKNFFKQVAPCTDMQEFYGRFSAGVAAGELHCTFRFHFPFKKNPRDVTITLFYNATHKVTWVLVQPFEEDIP